MKKEDHSGDIIDLPVDLGGSLDPLFLKVYIAAHNNAVSLLAEAEALYKIKKYPRAYFLAFTGLEEIAKSQLAADVYSGFTSLEEYRQYFANHKKKIGRMLWATLDAGEYLNLSEEYHEGTHPKVTRRMAALYVERTNESIVSPYEVITKEDAEKIINTLEVAIIQILKTEEFSGRIGTKGFMK